MTDRTQMTTKERLIQMESFMDSFENREEGQLKYPPNEQTIKSVEESVDIFLKNKVFDINWRDYFYLTSVFEAIGRYISTVSGTGATTVDQNGLILSTGATSGSDAGVSLGIANSTKLFQFDKETRFRTILKLDVSTNATLDIGSLQDTTASFIDFLIAEGAITGRSKDGTTTKTVALGSYSDNSIVELEFRYFPQERIVFFVNGVESGTITSNFPTDKAGAKYIFASSVQNSAAEDKNANVYFFEFIQKR